MRLSAMFYVVFTTCLLVLLAVMVTMDISFGWVFYIMCFGQAMVCLMAYKVLRDRYTTHKTFDDFYQDYDINR